MRRPAARYLALLAAGLLFLIAIPASAADNDPLAAFKVGTDVFRRILFDRDFSPLHSYGDLAKDAEHPQNSILIVFGDGSPLTKVEGGLKQFVEDGGALFLATDKRLSKQAESELFNTAGVLVTGQPIICKDKDSCYQEREYCPLLQQVPGANPNLLRNLIRGQSNLSRVATNVPSALAGYGWMPHLPMLASLPGHSVVEGDKSSLGSAQAFAVGDKVGNGRVLVLADHSIFINEMMLPNDNGNVEFTYNCLEWLRGDPQNPRNQVLFVQDGHINPRFEVPIKEVPDELLLKYLREHPDEAARLALTIAAHHPKETAKLALGVGDAVDKASQKVAPEVEQKIKEVDEADALNNALLDGVGDPNSLLRGLIVCLAVLVVLYGCYRIGWKARHRADMQGPLLSAALQRLEPAPSVADQRRRDLIRGDNFWEPARDLARQTLAAFDSAAGPPRIAATGGWLQRWTMMGRVRRLWRLAYGPPARVSLKEWQRLLREVQKLNTALANGIVALATAKEPRTQ